MGSAFSRNSVSIMQLFKDSISVEIFKSLLRFITDEIESVRTSDLKGCDVLLILLDVALNGMCIIRMLLPITHSQVIWGAFNLRNVIHRTNVPSDPQKNILYTHTLSRRPILSNKCKIFMTSHQE